TEPQHRGRGYATACAALVCDGVQKAGCVPVWSTSAEHVVSLRIAAKLGFAEAVRRVNIALML
ncbi:MAG: GNAT family N-acetyltransferase, partial [Gemmatimonadales bacterium]|nr:GNAT family N-acetyltransferase [Gemmatimonadales bacterium]